MALDQIIEVELRWWVVPYLHTLGFFACIVGVEPDVDRIFEFVCRYGMRLR